MTAPITELLAPPTSAGVRRRPLRRLLRSPGFLIPGIILVLMAIIAIIPGPVAGVFGNGDPRVCDLSSSGDGPASGHPFGFDLQGCDVFANVVFGTRTSMSVGLLTTVLAMTVAIVLGTVAGYFGGVIDWIVSRLTDVFLGFPFLLGAVIVLNSASERSVLVVSLVLALFGWPTLARLVRSSVKSVRGAEYVQAAQTMGLGFTRIVLRYVLPNSLAPVLVVATVTVGSVIVAESSLTYLGIGLAAPNISWGLQLASAQSAFQNSPHLLLFPSLFLAAAVLSIIALGDALRTALDPRRQQ